MFHIIVYFSIYIWVFCSFLGFVEYELCGHLIEDVARRCLHVRGTYGYEGWICELCNAFIPR